MLEIKGKVNTAICYAKVVEDGAIEQIRRMCDYPLTEGSRVRIMPDVHAGKGCTIGTTMTVKVIPRMNRINEYLDRSIPEIKSTLQGMREPDKTEWQELNSIFLQYIE